MADEYGVGTDYNDIVVEPTMSAREAGALESFWGTSQTEHPGVRTQSGHTDFLQELRTELDEFHAGAMRLPEDIRKGLGKETEAVPVKIISTVRDTAEEMRVVAVPSGQVLTQLAPARVTRDVLKITNVDTQVMLVTWNNDQNPTPYATSQNGVFAIPPKGSEQFYDSRPLFALLPSDIVGPVMCSVHDRFGRPQ